MSLFTYIEEGSELRDFLYNHNVYCYGAGKFGVRFVEYCLKYDLPIAGVVVSNDQKIPIEDCSILNLKIRHLNEIQGKQCAVIVAINEKMHPIIAENLSGTIPLENIRYLSNDPFFLIQEYDKEIERRKKIDLFNFRELAKPVEPITKDRIGYNYFYGHNKIVRKVLNLSDRQPLKAAISHAVNPGGILLWRDELALDDDEIKDVYVPSIIKRDILSRYVPKKNFISIGLFIQYVDRILSQNEFERIKRHFGKILLVFPDHSIPGIGCNFQVKKFIEMINKLKNDYDTVFVCLGYNDATSEIAEPYIKEDFMIVTSGYIFDYYFLYRLRTLIELSDMTVSMNYVGSQIGYSICLNRPVYIINQEINYKIGDNYLDLWDFIDYYKDKMVCYQEKEYVRCAVKEAKIAFGISSHHITEYQKEVVKRYWGEWGN